MVPIFQQYLDKHAVFSTFIKEPPSSDLKIVIIIPACNEPDITYTLQSLLNCKRIGSKVEVLILFNHAESADDEIKNQNISDYELTSRWAFDNNTPDLRFYPILLGEIHHKEAGVGYARKALMDEAIERFNQAGNEQGVIVSLDADSTVSTNYFVEIENAFFKPKPPCCAIFGFEHPYRLPGINPENRSAIVKYELYLRYYRWALARTGFPFPFYTIGSCFAVSALAYVKQGGMNRRQAGEDFYFLNKIFLLDKTIELNSIKVYPSCRVSNRVPFGTGAAVTKIISHNEWMVYQLCTFETLQQMFKSVKTLFKQRDLQIESYYFQLSGELKSFMAFDEFNAAINQINNNASSEEVFIKKFFQWFDAFKIIKYLNLIHTEQVPRISIEKAAKQLLLQLKVRFNDGANQEELLEIFKVMDNQSNIHIFRV
jgi:hypothetical protein